MKEIFTKDAPLPIGHYSQAMKAGGFLFLSGQIPVDPQSNDTRLFDGNVVCQTELILKNIAAVLASQNLLPVHVVKATIFLTDLSQFSKVNEVCAQFFGAHKPARSTVEVTALPKGAGVEIEVIAFEGSDA